MVVPVNTEAARALVTAVQVDYDSLSRAIYNLVCRSLSYSTDIKNWRYSATLLLL